MWATLPPYTLFAKHYPKEARARGAAGPFENDDAMDWVVDLEESRDARRAVEALRAAEGDGYQEAPEGSVAIAAAEVVAALAGVRVRGCRRRWSVGSKSATASKGRQ